MTNKEKEVWKLAEKLCGLVSGRYEDPYKLIAHYILKNYVPKNRKKVKR